MSNAVLYREKPFSENLKTKLANVNIKKFLLRHITDFELVLHLKNSKKFKLNLSLNGRALFLHVSRIFI